MSIDARVRELDHRHQHLKAMIEKAAKSPAVDSLYLMELKRRKLKLKEEIAHMKQALPRMSEPSFV